MFLQLVNKHSKTLLFLMVIFIIGQLFINYKRGMVITPFFHYGMYSGVINIRNSYQIFEVIQNGKRLHGQDFTPEQWDKIMLPLQYYAGTSKSNRLYETDIKRLLTKMNISSNDKNFITACNYQQFENWYKKYLSKITNQTTTSLTASYRTYLYQSNKLEATNTSLPLSQLCR